jgi:beta-glucosidase
MKRVSLSVVLSFIAIVAFASSCISTKKSLEQIPAEAKYKNASLPVEERINDLMSFMTLDEKVAQMAQAATYVASPADAKLYGLGSILVGGGDHPGSGLKAKDWLNFYNEYQKAAMQSRLGIPILFGVDAVHGNAKIEGATVFPHNIGLGAANDAALVENIGRVTAIESRASGLHWNFAPCVAVARDERWGRTYESFSESPDIVSPLGTAFVRGLENGNRAAQNSMAACVKHYFADGGAEWGSGTYGIDRGNSTLSDEDVRKIHLAPYVAALKEKPASVMISFSGIGGEEMHANKKWIDVLKDELQFEGIIISDWAGHKELKGENLFAQSINAGIDMIMIPEEYPDFVMDVAQNVKDGIITNERIDEAVRRILRVKFEMGLFEKALTDESQLNIVGSDEHMDVAREAVRKSLVLLKNENTVLPLSKTENVAIVGTKAKDMGVLCGGWTLYWGGYSEYETLVAQLEQNSKRVKSSGLAVKGKNILDAFTGTAGASVLYSDDGNKIEGAKKAIVVIGELPYVEFFGDSKDLSVSKADVEKIKKLKAKGISVIALIISGRPLIISDIEADCDAIVAAWLPGSMAGPGIADVLYGDHDFSGKLSFTWPKDMAQLPINVGDGKEGRYPFGYGLRYKQ